MAIRFEDDALGCVLEFLFLHKNGTTLDKKAWCEANGIRVVSIGADGNDPFMGSGATAHLLEYALRQGRKGELKAHGYTRRKQINRIFQKLQSEMLIDPLASDDKPATLMREINIFGEELFMDGSFREFIGGAKVIYKKWKSSVCSICSPGYGMGTGFLVKKDMILTAKHVIKPLLESGKMEVVFTEESKFVNPIKFIIAKEEFIDLGAIVFDESELNVNCFSITNSIDPLDDVITFGYPPISGSDDAYLVAHKGEVSSIVNLRDGVQSLIISSLMRGGNSGGPVIDRRGKVAGVILENRIGTYGSEEIDTIQKIGYSTAIHPAWIIDFLGESIELEHIDAQSIRK